MQMQNVDVVIVGGGMVGLGLAAALKGSALKVAVIEGQLPEPALDEAPDNRVSALSPPAAGGRLARDRGPSPAALRADGGVGAGQLWPDRL